MQLVSRLVLRGEQIVSLRREAERKRERSARGLSAQSPSSVG